jgi:putative hydrolase of the HAD superfamily
VTFDLWETLITDKPEDDLARRGMRCEGLQSMLSKHGIELELSDLLRAYDQSAEWLRSTWSRLDEVSTIEQIRFIVDTASGGKADLPDSGEALNELEEAYVAPLFSLMPVPKADTIPTLQAMRARVHKIGLISNTGRTPGHVIRKLLDKLGIGRFLDAAVFSNEIGRRKPDKRIFLTAARELGVEVGSIVHIGDHPEADVWGAKQVGMRAILLDYEIPEGFKRNPSSLAALSRAMIRVRKSEIVPDARITNLKESLQYLDRFS